VKRDSWQVLGALVMVVLLMLTLASPVEAQRRRRGFPETPSAEGRALFDLRSGFQRLSTGDTRGAVALLTRAIESEALPVSAAGSAHFFRGAAYREQSKFSESLDDLEKAGQLTPDKGQVPVLAFDVALRMDRPLLAHEKALLVARKFPADVGSLDLSAINTVIARLDKERKANEAHDLRAALFEAGYQGSPVGETADYLFRDLVDSYLVRNDLVNAIRVSGTITTVDVLVAMLIDARYQELWDSLQGAMGGSFSAAAKRQMARYQEIVRELPEDGQAVNMLVDSLRLTGAPREAVSIGGRLLDDPVAIGRDPEAYFWVLVKTAYAEAESDRPAEAVRRMADLAAFKLDDYPDLVNHHLNRAALLLDLGRFEEAVAAARVAQSRYLSRFGQLWVAAIETCAASQSGRRNDPGVASGLQGLKDGAVDNPSAYSLGLLCANRMNEAEEWYVRRLDTPGWREAALRALQSYNKAPAEGLFFAQIQQRLDMLRRKNSVRRAVSKVGRQLTIDLPRTQFGDY
jgi:tetratricopeptide (TPR) repeat protein